MAFQNNSGDIILDVVLTDEGRRRLAKGDGSFEITQFALADDEINYSLFNTATTTALQDLSILQTPILEAFTNNSSMMKSKLLSLPSESDLLYLPILKLNEQLSNTAMHTRGNFVVCVDSTTWDDSDQGTTLAIAYNGRTPRDGMIYGLDEDGLGSYIAVDSGIDSTDMSRQLSLVENSFMIEIDNRLGQIVDQTGKTVLVPESIDDDNIATYIVSRNDVLAGSGIQSQGNLFIKNVEQSNGFSASDSPINGPIGARLEFKIRSSEELRSSNFLFDRIGTTDTTNYSDKDGNPQSIRLIDTMVRVSGMTRGYSIDIPIRFAKSIA